MQDAIWLGPTPAEEPCVRVGVEGYGPRARAECQAYVHQLRRTFGPEPDGAKLAVRECDHDLGQYFEVVCAFDDQIPEAVDYAYRCEQNAPTTWDAGARAELTGSEQETPNGQR